MKSLVLLAAFGLVSVAHTDAAAYEFYKAAVSGDPLHWEYAELKVCVSTVAPDEVDWAAYQALVQPSFDAWLDVPGARVPQVDVDCTTDDTTITSPTSFNDPPSNVVVFIKDAAEWRSLPMATSTQIALTFIAHDETTGQIIDADIAINDAGHDFVTSGCGMGSVDLQSALTHEVGHFFGLDHSADASATMTANYGLAAGTCDQARTLEQDDTDGIAALYADVVFKDPPGTETPDDGGGDDGCQGAGDGPVAPWLFALGALGWIAVRRQRVGA